ncbi:calcium-binding protein [Pseudooceanicola sp. C21-150M6]|uniref:calcium-binding protein n=1 Tax=Pseudooceanicola sp. C21-150M6 TaxID=3434355 RepID=UPI003D7FE96A
MPIEFTNPDQGTAAADTLDYAGDPNFAGPLRVDGAEGDDEIRLNGYTGIALAGSGDDFVAANHGDDTVKGEEGNDTLLGQGGSDKLFGGDGDDELEGGSGFDRIFGGSGDDRIVGGNDDDVLYGDNRGPGLDGSVGDDVFVFDDDDGNDKVWDFSVGDDLVELTDGTGYTLSYSGDNTIMTYGATTVTFYNATLTADDIYYATDMMMA